MTLAALKIHIDDIERASTGARRGDVPPYKAKTVLPPGMKVGVCGVVLKCVMVW